MLLTGHAVLCAGILLAGNTSLETSGCRGKVKASPKAAGPCSRQLVVQCCADDGSAEPMSTSSKTGAPRFPFTSVPVPRAIPVGEHKADAPRPGGANAVQAGADPQKRGELIGAYRFYRPAQFPLREFGARGEVCDREGAVIYEGMEFLTYDDGRYEMNCLVSAPAMPTTLRLQLQVQAGSSAANPWRTITLPPVRINAARESGQDLEPGIWRIRHAGYSPAIDASDGVIRKVRRAGTARFGFGGSS